jgi:1-acyl-sn-glycerol-3-phosphate acyltransferase
VAAVKKWMSFWLCVYPASILIGIIVVVLRSIGLIRVRGHQLPRGQKSIMMVSNHPSLWEPIILIGLFFGEYLFRPWRIPWSTPDQRNYADTWYWGLFRARFIPVPRGSPIGEARALFRIITTIESGKSVILFPEGGRTGKGDQFLFSRSGKRLRETKNGIGRISCRTACTVVPVWVDGVEEILPIGTWFPRVWRGMTITIGEPFCEEHREKPAREDFEKGMERIVNALLKTAD